MNEELTSEEQEQEAPAPGTHAVEEFEWSFPASAHAKMVLKEAYYGIVMATRKGSNSVKPWRSPYIDDKALSAVTRVTHDRNIFNIVSKLRYAEIVSDYKNTSELSGKDLREKASELMLWYLVHIYSSPQEENSSFKHHWVPLCYVYHFLTEKRADRGVVLEEYRFDYEGKIVKSKKVTDSLFCHPKLDTGFYPQLTEIFFSRIERLYATLITAINKGETTEIKDLGKIIIIAFLSIQSARQPKILETDSKSSVYGDPQNAIPEIFEGLDKFNTSHFRIASSDNRLLFNPGALLQSLTLADGTTVRILPVTPQHAVLISDREILTEEADNILENYAKMGIKAAAAAGYPLYGNMNSGNISL